MNKNQRQNDISELKFETKIGTSEQNLYKLRWFIIEKKRRVEKKFIIQCMKRVRRRCHKNIKSLCKKKKLKKKPMSRLFTIKIINYIQ